MKLPPKLQKMEASVERMRTLSRILCDGIREEGLTNVSATLKTLYVIRRECDILADKVDAIYEEVYMRGTKARL